MRATCQERLHILERSKERLKKQLAQNEDQQHRVTKLLPLLASNEENINYTINKSDKERSIVLTSPNCVSVNQLFSNEYQSNYHGTSPQLLKSNIMTDPKTDIGPDNLEKEAKNQKMFEFKSRRKEISIIFIGRRTTNVLDFGVHCGRFFKCTF